MDFHLNEDIFKIVKNGTKHIEIRLNDKKRQSLKIGDNLTFIDINNENKKINTVIKDLKYFKNINELVNTYDMKDMYLEECSKEEFKKLLNKFYSDEEIEKYGIVAIDFEKKEKSCGCLVFKDDKVLLVHQSIGHWSLPKGHVEENEEELETAIRETKEETNIDVEIISDFRKVISYSPKLNTIKDVVFFIARPLSYDINPQENETTEAKYVGIEEAIELLKYDMKDLLLDGYNEYKKIEKRN